MNELAKRELQLDFIPGVLKNDFEDAVMEAYFIYGYHDLHHVGFVVEDFSVYTASFDDTGNAFEYYDNDVGEEVIADIKGTSFNSLIGDINIILNYHRMFFAWDDRGEENYEYVGLYNVPVKEVW